MGLNVGNLPVKQVYVGSTPVQEVYVGSLKVWSAKEVVQITLATGQGVQYQLRDALNARGLNYRTVTELPFNIELVGKGSAGSLFDGFAALKSVPAMNTSQVTNMERMFYDCSALTSVPVMNTSQVTSTAYMFRSCSSLTDENVRLIGKNPNVDTSSMIDRSGLTKEPFYATDRLPNPPAPRVVTIRKHSTIYGQWDKNSATGDVSLIQGWVGNEDVRFTAYVTCDVAVMSGDSYMTQEPGAVLRSGADISPWSSSGTYTFTEVI